MTGWWIAFGVVAASLVGFWLVRRRLLAWLLKIPPPQNGWRSTWTQVPVPTAPGVSLATQHLAPTTPGPHPTILMRTPYGQGWVGGPAAVVNQLFATLLAERGFHVVQQDVRGRFDSTGEFSAFVHEREDGLATLDWMAAQPWFDGRLGLFGQSYGGYIQWAIADDDRVQCMVPLQTTATLGRIMHEEGTIAIETALRFLAMMALFGDDTSPNRLVGTWKMLRQTAMVRPPAMTLPLLHTDEAMLGREESAYREAMLASSPQSDYQRRVDMSEVRDRAKAPALFITGWLDPFLRESLDDFVAVADRREAWLLCGPWPHGAIAGDWLNETLTFLDHHLKGGPPLQRRRVKLAEMTTGAWTEHDAWPLTADHEVTFFAAPGGELRDGPVDGDGASTLLVFDPAAPTPHLGGALLDLEGCGLLDNASLEARDDVLTFTSAPLQAPLVLSGAPRVHLCADSDAPTTDFFLRLNHVRPSGKSTNVVDRFVRRAPGQLPVDEPFELFPIVYRFEAGDRLRLLIASGAHPRYARNHGTPEPQATAVDMLEQRNRVLHDAERQTRLTLPLRRG